MIISLIAAMSRNRVIGLNERLPWGSLPKDWENLFVVTEGKRMIMGRKSYDSEDRIWSKVGNFVISRQENLQLEEGFELKNSLSAALRAIQPNEEVFILGGGEIFREAIKLADRIHLTIVNAEFEGDTFFPDFEETEFKLKSSFHHPEDEKHHFDFWINLYEKDLK